MHLNASKRRECGNFRTSYMTTLNYWIRVSYMTKFIGN